MKGYLIFGRKPTHFLLSLVLVAACGTGYYYVNEANTNLKPILPPLAAQRNLQEWLAPDNNELMESEPLFHHGVVNEIYRRVDFKLLWLNNYELSVAGELLLEQLRESSADDLIDYNYHLAYLQQRLYSLPTRPKDATAVDILLTDAFISYAEDVLSNKLTTEFIANAVENPQEGLRKVSLAFESPLNSHTEHEYIVSLVAENNRPNKLTKVLSELHPAHEGYARLRDALRQYQRIAASGQWRTVDSGPNLRKGNQHEQVIQLRNLLTLYRDYPLPQSSSFFSWLTDEKKPEPADPDVFDDALVESLKHFQQRHGKTASGMLDKDTRALLNVPPNLRIKQISYNMKRWRELPADLGDRYIWVNLNDYHLDVIYKGRSEMQMKVIVGKISRRTPVMQQSISSIVLNPSWNVPRRIMVQDILPQLKKDPNYLTDRNIRILDGWSDSNEIASDALDLTNMSPRQFPYRLRQDPGADNALGKVKFVIPNDYSIYLHDTNHPDLFSKEYRALSSGCVRVEKPLELAELLLQSKSGWNRNKIDEIVSAGETTYVRLPEEVPTYLLYWTTWVNAEGTIQFRDDIYSLESLLNRKDQYNVSML